MGCTQSKIENEEAVARCKQRKHFMKEAVSGRNAFAAAHSAYAMSLKNTGAALSDYAHGEVQNPQLAFHGNSSHSSSSVAAATSTAATQAPFDQIKPPPPPPMPSYQPPLQRAASMPEINAMPKNREPNGVGATIMEENDDDEEEDEIEKEKLIGRRRSSRNRSGDNHQTVAGPTSPERQTPQVQNSGVMQETNQQYGMYDFFFPNMENMPGTTLEEVKMEKYESEQRKVFNERPKREEFVEEKVNNVAAVVEEKAATAAVEEEKVVAVAQGVGEGTAGRNMKRGKTAAGGGMGEKKLAKGSVNLFQIFTVLDDHFLQASESAHEVSKMLEATRLHYHSNFADNRGNFFY